MCIYKKVEEECQLLTVQFSGIKIRIAKRYGKRVSNLFSCGVETFAPIDTIELDNSYVMFLQNFTGDSYEKDIIMKTINKLIVEKE
jgi:hypothetical protein